MLKLNSSMEDKIQSLSAEQIDILREIGSICVGNTSGIISQLLGGRVDVQVSALDLLSVSELAEYITEKGKMVFGVNAQITSQVEGTIFLLFPEQDALKIIDKFLKDIDTTGISTIQYGISIIKEVGGIAIFAYINTLSSLIKKLIVSSVPSFMSGTIDGLLDMILREYEHWGDVCAVHTFFREKSLNIEGVFYLVLEKKSAELILESIQRGMS